MNIFLIIFIVIFIIAIIINLVLTFNIFAHSLELFAISLFNIFEDFHPEWKETDDGKEISSKAVTYNSTKPLNATELEDENKMEEIIITNDNVNKTTSKVKANKK